MSSIQFFLLAGGQGERMRPLTVNTPKPMVRFGPFGRIIDFSLYNVLAAEVGDLIVLTQYQHGLIDLYLGMQWRAALSSQGRRLNLLSGKSSPKREYLGTADAIYQALITSTSMPDRLVVLAADHVGRINFNKLIDFHDSHGAAATMALTRCNVAQGVRQKRIAQVRDDGRVINIHTDVACPPVDPAAQVNPAESMDVYVFTTSKLISFLELNQREESHDLDHDLIPMVAQAGELKACLLSGPQEEGLYWRDIDDLYTYWLSHLELLSGRIKDLYFDPAPGLMRPPVSRFNVVHEYESGDKRIYNSMVRSVENIGASLVEDSVIGPGALVEDGAEIRQSVIMEGAHIRQGTRLRSTLVEPQVEVRPGFEEQDKEKPKEYHVKLMRGLHQMMSPPARKPSDTLVRPLKEA